MTIPTEGEAYTKLMDHLRLAQESCATLANLAGCHSRPQLQRQWLTIEDFFKSVQHKVTLLAQSTLR